MQPIGPWLEEHPFGLSLAARLRFEHGDVEGAVARQRSATSTWPEGSDNAALQQLLSFYEAAATAQGRQGLAIAGLAALPRLLTLI